MGAPAKHFDTQKAEVPSALHRLLAYLHSAVSALGNGEDWRWLEKNALLIHEAMTQKNRVYHNYEHLFEMIGFSDAEGPVEVLAILFHDIVYWQADRSLSPAIAELTAPWIPDESGTLNFPNEAANCPEGRSRVAGRSMLGEIFGIQPGTRLTVLNGLNEFLSAAAAERALQDKLPPWELAQILFCIEATIPFRAPDANGIAPAVRAKHWLGKHRFELKAPKNKDEAEKAYGRILRVVGRDLSNFASEDPGIFLGTSWKLLVENNLVLLKEGYKISEYRKALHGMEKFLSNLKPELVLSNAIDTISAGASKRTLSNIERNLLIGSHYLRVKLLASGLIEAIALLTGGDAPIILFIGDARDPKMLRRLKTFLKQETKRNLKLQIETEQNSLAPAVERLLEFGRSLPTNFDTQASPIGLALYRNIGHENIGDYYETAKRFFDGEITPEQYLSRFDPSLLTETILPAIAHFAWTRVEEVEQLRTTLKVVRRITK